MRVLLVALLAAISYAQTEKNLASNCIGSQCNHRKGGGKGKGVGRPFSEGKGPGRPFSGGISEPRNNPPPPTANVKGSYTAAGMGSRYKSQVPLKEVNIGTRGGKGRGKGKGVGPKPSRGIPEESRNEPFPTPHAVNMKGRSSTIGTGSGHRPQVRRKEVSVGNSDMPDIVLIGDSLLDNKCDKSTMSFVGFARDDAGNKVEDAPLIECNDPGVVNPSMEKALTDAGFTVKSFANYGWTLRAIEELEYPELVEFAEARNNDIIVIYSGGGNDASSILDDYTQLWKLRSRVQAFGDKLLQHSSLVISITPPFDIDTILGFDTEIDSSVVDWYLGYDKEILIKFSEFCTPGPDGVHPDNTCAQQMHQKIIDVLNRHKCSGGSCECKDEFHGDRCEENCWTTDTWCWNCHNCCNGSYWSWGTRYCSAETTMNSMSALNGTQFVGALAIFGFISLFYWIVRSFWRCYFKQSEFVKIQDAVANL